MRLTRWLLVITVLLCSAAMASAQLTISMYNVQLGKYIHNWYEGSYLLLANKTGVGSADIFVQEAAPAHPYYYLKCTVNNKYITVDASNNLVASVTTPGNNEKFQWFDQGGGLWAMKSVKNGLYVTANSWGPNYQLQATKSSVTNWEKFATNGIVDLWVAFNAFATLHPNYLKLSNDVTTYPYTWPGCMHPNGFRGATDLSQRGFNYWYWVICDYRYSQQGMPGYDKNLLEWVGDWETISCDATEPYFNPDRTGDPNAPPMWYWWSAIMRTHRYANPAVDELTGLRAVNFYIMHNDGSMVFQNTANYGGRRHIGVLRNYSNPYSAINMGNRWVVDIECCESAYPNGTGEIWTIDLGPAVGTFAPEFGFVEYQNSGGHAVFSNIQSKDAHAYYQNMWYTNFPLPVDP